MVGRWAYDLMYRWRAPWEGVGVRDDLRLLLDRGDVTPATHPRALDLGCGTGANVVHLADRGFDVTGVDFSEVALGEAHERARQAGVVRRCRFVNADLTDPALHRTLGSFDLLVDFGTLDDLTGDRREAMARNIGAMSAPGAVFLFWCFYAERAELPIISFSGPSRLAPAIEPGEVERLFGEAFDVDRLRGPRDRAACFVLQRHA